MFRNLASTVVAAVIASFFMLPTNVEAAPRKKGTYITKKVCKVYNGRTSCKYVKVKRTKYATKKKNTKRKYAVIKRQTTQPNSSPFFTSTPQALHTEAMRFFGLHERQHTRTLSAVLKVNPIRTPWCAAFVNAVLHRQGQRGSGSNRAISFARYGNRVHAPTKGDIVVFRSHVGFFQGYVNRGGRTYVAVLGGNQNNRVQVSYFAKSRVVAYRRVA